MELKGSATEQNLKDAFAGESQANRRYLYFASKADVEGYNDVAAVFRSTAEVRLAMRTVTLSTWKRLAIPRPGCRWATPRRILRRQSPVRLTSTLTCTRVWLRPHVTRASTRSQTGSKRWPRPSAATPIASRRRWITSTANPGSRLSTMRGALCSPCFFRLTPSYRSFCPVSRLPVTG